MNGSRSTGGPRRTGLIPSWFKPYLAPRALVVMGVVLAYVWRFHDLSPVLTPLRLAAIFTVTSWGYLILAPRVGLLKKALSYPYVWPFFVWFAWMAIGTRFALSPQESSDFLIQVHLKTATMFLFLLGFFSHPSKVRILTVTHIFGASAICFYYAKAGFPTGWTPTPMHDRNDLALHLVAVAPLAFFIAQTETRKRARIAAWVAGLFIAGSAVMSQSRGGFLAILGIMIYYMFRARGVSWRGRILPPVLVGIGLLVAPASVKDRVATLFDLSEDYNVESPVGRIEVWKRGLRYTMDNWVFGVGAKGFPIAEGTLSPQARSGDTNWTRKVAHNSFLEVAAESGLVGLALFLTMFVTVLARLSKLRKRFARGQDPGSVRGRQLCDAMTASFIGFIIGGFFLSQGYAPFLFTLFAMAAGVEMTLSSARLPRAAVRAGRSAQPDRNGPSFPHRVPQASGFLR